MAAALEDSISKKNKSKKNKKKRRGKKSAAAAETKKSDVAQMTSLPREVTVSNPAMATYLFTGIYSWRSSFIITVIN